MPCYSPRDVWPPKPGAPDRRPVSSPSQSYAGARSFQLPCGQCIGCLLGRSQEWAHRLVHEAQMHQSSVFLTPTYSDEHLPKDLSVSVREHQLFIKRCRHELGSLRFFGCGEYGGVTKRPHYHTVLFGVDLPDKRLHKKTPSGSLLYSSATIDRLWGKGFCTVGQLNSQSAAYAARYCLKKVAGKGNPEYYRRVDAETGVVWYVKPEFVVMSRRPGLGATWFQKFRDDCFPSDFLIVDGKKVPVPSFYLEKLPEGERLAVMARRKLDAHARRASWERRGMRDEGGDSRLLVRNEAKHLQAARLKRGMEDET